MLRHMSRLTSPARQAGWALGALVLIAVTTGLLQQFWAQYPVYSGSPRVYARWAYLFLIAEMVVVLPWAALRGSEVWVRLRRDGQLDEYRRTRLRPASIVLGALWGSLKPVFWFLVGSAACLMTLAMVGDLTRRVGANPSPSTMEVLAAHALLAVLAASYAMLGQWTAREQRGTSVSITAALALLSTSTFAVCGLNPVASTLTDPDGWLYWLLTPNPVAAMGAVLGLDLLRFGWVYDNVRALDYASRAFSYPPPAVTAGLHLVAAVILAASNSRWLDRLES